MIHIIESIVLILAIFSANTDGFWTTRPLTNVQWKSRIVQHALNFGPQTQSLPVAAVTYPSWTSHSKRRFHHFRRRLTPLKAVSVGDILLAEVDDFGGTVENPTVEFLIKDGGKNIKGTMSTKALPDHVRLVLRSGTVFQVSVVNADDKSNIQVALNSGYSGTMDATPEAAPKSFKPPPTMSTSEAMESPVKKNLVSPPPAKRENVITIPGLLLNNLKTGMQLEGKVASSTSYAAFVNVGVYRKGKAGQFTEVSGMLHKSDMSKDVVQMAGSKGFGNVADKGSKITVFVKEVWKNSGRFTLTMDGAINKENLLQLKDQVKEEGKERRASRRLRKQVETVALGDMVKGVIDKVIPEGILVSITSLGPLGITGLISKADLPKQFEIPPDMRESFQIQLLQQDFKVGRGIACSVSKVNTHINDRMLYNLKLEFESFDAASDAAAVAPDELDDVLKDISIGDNEEEEDGDDNEEDEEEDDSAGVDNNNSNSDNLDELEVDADVRDIFDELKGSQPMLPIANIYDWGDVQDMLADGSINKAALDKAIADQGAKNGFVNVRQFANIITALQDNMDAGDLDVDVDMDIENAAEESVEEVVVEEMEEEEEEEEEDMETVVREIYDELRGSAKSLSVATFKSWSDIKDLLDGKLITKAFLDEQLKAVGVKSVISFEQFWKLIDIIDDVAAENDDNEEEEEEDKEEVVEEVVKKVEMVKAVPVAVKTTKAAVVKQVPIKQQQQEEEEVEEEEDDGEDYDTVLREIYDDLRGSAKKLSVKALKTWEDITELIQDGFLKKADLDSIIEDAAKSKKDSTLLDFDQFAAIANAIDDIAGEEEEDGEDGDEDEGELSPEELEEMTREIFETLKGKKGTVAVKTFMTWDYLQDILAEGIIEKSAVTAILKDMGVKATGELNFEQFSKLVTAIDDTVNQANEEEEEEEENEEAVEDREAAQLFKSIKGKSPELSMKSFLESDFVKQALAASKSSGMDKKVLTMLLQGMGVGKDAGSNLSLEQFIQAKQLLDQTKELEVEAETKPSAAAAADKKKKKEVEKEDEEEELSDEMFDEMRREIFDELKSPKSGKVTIKKLKGWESIKEALDSGELTRKELDQALAHVGIVTGNDSLDFQQFCDLIDLLDNEMAAGEGEEDEDEEDIEVTATSTATASTGKGFGKPAPAVAVAPVGVVAKGKGDSKSEGKEIFDKALEAAKEIYNELRGKKKVLTVDQFKKWEDTQGMLEDGILKHSTLEKALVKIGSYATQEITLDQFIKLIDIIQQNIDVSKLSVEEEDNDDEEENDEELEDDGLSEIFDELRGKSKALSIDGFLGWNDVKELLEMKALKKEDISKAAKDAGIKFQKSTMMNFEEFQALVDAIDQYIDESKLPEEEDDEEEENVVDTSAEISSSIDDDNDDDVEDDLVDDEDEEAVYSEEDLKLMFNDLSNGKDFIAEKKLLKWNDLQEIIDSGIITKNTVNEYYKRLNVKDGKVNFDQFCLFLNDLDKVLVDANGNLLDIDDSDQAIDLDAL